MNDRPRINKADNASQPTEQPKCKTCKDTGNVLEPRKDSPGVDWEPCPDCDVPGSFKPEQPNTNAMTIVSIDGAIDVALNLLDQLRPKTEQVNGCITTLKSWKDNNFKHLRKALE